MKYSKPFQKLIDACKKTEWILTRHGTIRLKTERYTCPMSFVIGQHGLCSPISAWRRLGFRSQYNAWTIAAAADNVSLSPLEQKVRAALIAELRARPLEAGE